jgi:hypothetical protein
LAVVVRLILIPIGIAALLIATTLEPYVATAVGAGVALVLVASELMREHPRSPIRFRTRRNGWIERETNRFAAYLLIGVAFITVVLTFWHFRWPYVAVIGIGVVLVATRIFTRVLEARASHEGR